MMRSPWFNYSMAVLCALMMGGCIAMQFIFPNPAAVTGIISGAVGIASSTWGMHMRLQRLNRGN